jgi:hypothetical protein
MELEIPTEMRRLADCSVNDIPIKRGKYRPLLSGQDIRLVRPAGSIAWMHRKIAEGNEWQAYRSAGSDAFWK